MQAMPSNMFGKLEYKDGDQFSVPPFQFFANEFEPPSSWGPSTMATMATATTTTTTVTTTTAMTTIHPSPRRRGSERRWSGCEGPQNENWKWHSHSLILALNLSVALSLHLSLSHTHTHVLSHMFLYPPLNKALSRNLSLSSSHTISFALWERQPLKWNLFLLSHSPSQTSSFSNELS